MYQRFDTVPFNSDKSARSPSFDGDPASEAQDQADHEAQGLIDHREEQAGDDHHHEHHDRRDHGLAARRPGHLVGFRAHLLCELERAFHQLLLLCVACVDVVVVSLPGSRPGPTTLII